MLVYIDGTLAASSRLGETGGGWETEGDRDRQTDVAADTDRIGEHTKWKEKKKYIFQSCMELGSFPIQFPIHNGLAWLCAEAQARIFFMSIRDNCVRRWLSAALTWEILNLSSLQLLPHGPPLWLFLKTPSAPFPSHDATQLTCFTPLYRVRGCYCIFLQEGKVWRLAEKKLEVPRFP